MHAKKAEDIWRKRRVQSFARGGSHPKWREATFLKDSPGNKCSICIPEQEALFRVPLWPRGRAQRKMYRKHQFNLCLCIREMWWTYFLKSKKFDLLKKKDSIDQNGLIWPFPALAICHRRRAHASRGDRWHRRKCGCDSRFQPSQKVSLIKKMLKVRGKKDIIQTTDNSQTAF